MKLKEITIGLAIAGARSHSQLNKQSEQAPLPRPSSHRHQNNSRLPLLALQTMRFSLSQIAVVLGTPGSESPSQPIKKPPLHLLPLSRINQDNHHPDVGPNSVASLLSPNRRPRRDQPTNTRLKSAQSATIWRQHSFTLSAHLHTPIVPSASPPSTLLTRHGPARLQLRLSLARTRKCSIAGRRSM